MLISAPLRYFQSQSYDSTFMHQGLIAGLELNPSLTLAYFASQSLAFPSQVYAQWDFSQLYWGEVSSPTQIQLTTCLCSSFLLTTLDLLPVLLVLTSS